LGYAQAKHFSASASAIRLGSNKAAVVARGSVQPNRRRLFWVAAIIYRPPHTACQHATYRWAALPFRMAISIMALGRLAIGSQGCD